MRVHVNFSFYICSLILGTFITLNENHAFTAGATVTIPDLGTLQGGENSSFPLYSPSTRTFFYFAGIPYAKPESYTAKNRFKPSEIWEGALPVGEAGTFLATDHTIKCPQSASSNGQTEECLVLTVNTPDPKASERYPVIVFIHGGGFDSGWTGLYRGNRFLAKDVVLVTINYRLGLLGSLNLGIDDAPGNAALYDVVTALKWVKRYIEHFGGDKDKITVAGHSAGAVLATHLLTTELDIDDENGLPSVQGIIGLSGSSLSQTLATCTDPLAHHLAVSKLAGCDFEASGAPNVQVIRDCLVEKSPAVLLDAMNQYAASEMSQGRFGLDAKLPSLQSKSFSKPFMTEAPYQKLAEGNQKLDIPVMMGATRHDGSYLVERMLEGFWRPKNYTNDPSYLRNALLPAILDAFDLKDDSLEFTHSLENLYFGEAAYADDFDSKIPGLIDVFSVLAFKGGAYNLVELNAKKNPSSYYFSFEYRGVCTTDNGQAIPGGVMHTDPLFYLFPTTSCLMLLPGDLSVSNQLLNYWVNFAKNGNPNGSGKKTIVAPYNPLNHAYAVIDGYDRTAYYCRDAWIKNSLELMKEEEQNPSTIETTTGTDEEGTTPVATKSSTTSTTPKSSDNNTAATTVHLNLNFILCLLVCVLINN